MIHTSQSKVTIFLLSTVVTLIIAIYYRIPTMTSYTRIAAVSGGNKGVGLAIVRQLALQYPQSSFNNGPLLIYLTARDEGRGQEALKKIQEDAQLLSAKALRSQGGLTDIKYLSLDIDDEKSVDEFASQLKKSHPDGLDILINNAAVALDGFNKDIVKKTLHSNYYGTLHVTEKLLPQIRDGGRVVNVASIGGQLTDSYSSENRKRFRDANKIEEITALMEEFTRAVEENSYKGKWPGAAYRVSKAGVIGMTRVLAAQYASNGSKILVNAVCPGYVNTDMSKGNGVLTPDQGAQTPVLLALGDIKGATGEFWQKGKTLSW